MYISIEYIIPIVFVECGGSISGVLFRSRCIFGIYLFPLKKKKKKKKKRKKKQATTFSSSRFPTYNDVISKYLYFYLNNDNTPTATTTTTKMLIK